MLKCKYLSCRWPECDKTCGLVPTGDYIVGSCPEEGLIYELQNQIKELRGQLGQVVVELYTIKREVNKAVGNANELMGEGHELRKHCLHGYVDCIHNPYYLKTYHRDWWIELGMPTECNEETCYYDDEDK